MLILILWFLPQSLNTVCGTACRLSQCLAQVSSESGHPESYANPGQTNTNPVREAADIWEGVARAVGVASAAVKTQMLVLLQEVQARPDMSENSRRQEINRVSLLFVSWEVSASKVGLERKVLRFLCYSRIFFCMRLLFMYFTVTVKLFRQSVEKYYMISVLHLYKFCR